MTTKTNAAPVEILMVEDNPGDVRLAEEALREADVANNLTVAEDGEEAMALLRAKDQNTAGSRPDLILLDLNLPKRDGREVLADIKADPQLRRIPVVVLTTSRAEQDVLKCYDLHANAYIVKPVDLDQFMDVVTAVEKFWLTIVTLPPE